jgi:galactonate dehydratase
MRITAVSATIAQDSGRNFVFVRVDTDERGIFGWGEATLGFQPLAVAGAIDDVAPLLVGEDPFRVDHLWQSMYRRQFFKGGSVTSAAISGIDQALWDIKGKALEVPVFELLGGRVRDRVRVYDQSWSDESWVFDPNRTESNVRDIQTGVSASIAAGFTAIKLLPNPPCGALDTNAVLSATVAAVEAARDTAGEAVDMMLDFHGRTDPATAIQFAHALVSYRPWFIEEPCQPENVDAMAQIARSTSIPIATGERRFTRHEFRELLEKQACAVVQPDVCYCGGISELLKIGNMAEPYYVAVAPHNPNGPIATAASVHVALSLPNFLILEQVPTGSAFADAFFEIEDGYFKPPERPGLGIELRTDLLAQRIYAPRQHNRATAQDGSVADW